MIALAVLASACGRSGMLAPSAPPGAIAETPTPIASPTPAAGPFGDGRDGALDHSAGALALNSCEPVLSSGASSVSLGVGNLAEAGDRLLLVQVQGGASPDSGDQAPLGLAHATGTGLWELAEVASVSGGTVTFTDALAFGYTTDSGHRAQACRVPQFTDVALASGASLVASPWDGETGGVVALLVSGTFALDGRVTASGAGFRGGAASTAQGGGGGGLTDADTSDDDGGEKGEGFDVAAWSLNGRGNVHSGAGGGNRRSSGGGGGGSAGEGGTGGFERGAEVDLTRGQGGARYDAPLTGRLLFGGGGGGGHRVAADAGGSGGAGGGLVLVLAPTLTGGGAIEADGADGQDAGDEAGAGGGGGGGTIVVWSNGPIALHARGGRGGDSNDDEVACGPGGGGGGGTVLVHSSGASPETTGGAPGMSELSEDTHGASSGADGRTTAFQK